MIAVAGSVASTPELAIGLGPAKRLHEWEYRDVRVSNASAPEYGHFGVKVHAPLDAHSSRD